MMKKLILSVSVAGILVGSLLAKDFWQEKPFSEWKQKEVVRLLLDSPWADAETFDLRGLSSSGRAGAQRRYYVRFHSALPIRMAVARNAVLEGRASQEQAQEFVETHPAPGYVVVGLSVATGQARAELTRLTTEILRQRAYLELKTSGRRVHLEKYENPNQVGGGEAYLYFPRMKDGTDIFTPQENEVRFHCELDPETWIRLPFKLVKMVFNGVLEI